MAVIQQRISDLTGKHGAKPVTIRVGSLSWTIDLVPGEEKALSEKIGKLFGDSKKSSTASRTKPTAKKTPSKKKPTAAAKPAAKKPSAKKTSAAKKSAAVPKTSTSATSSKKAPAKKKASSAKPRRKSSAPSQTAIMREWAKKQGTWTIPPRGPLKPEIVAAYNKANPKK